MNTKTPVMLMPGQSTPRASSHPCLLALNVSLAIINDLLQLVYSFSVLFFTYSVVKC